MMSSFSAMPRDGQLEQLFHVFAFLKQHHNSRFVFDPTYPHIDVDKFERKCCKQHYGDTKEEISDDCPDPLGQELLI